jgi:serine/threonine protein kinase
LKYLHSQHLAHGDLHGVRSCHYPKIFIPHSMPQSNIFISDDGRPCLADFGLTVIGDITISLTMTNEQAVGAMRWLAPELLFDEKSYIPKTPAADVFSFGRICLAVRKVPRIMFCDSTDLIICSQVCTTRHPFHETPDRAVIFRVIQGANPHRPSEEDCGGTPISDALWTIMTQCWDKTPDARPEIEHILPILKAQSSSNEDHEDNSLSAHRHAHPPLRPCTTPDFGHETFTNEAVADSSTITMCTPTLTSTSRLLSVSEPVASTEPQTHRGHFANDPVMSSIQSPGPASFAERSSPTAVRPKLAKINTQIPSFRLTYLDRLARLAPVESDESFHLRIPPPPTVPPPLPPDISWEQISADIHVARLALVQSSMEERKRAYGEAAKLFSVFKGMGKERRRRMQGEWARRQDSELEAESDSEVRSKTAILEMNKIEGDSAEVMWGWDDSS